MTARCYLIVEFYIRPEGASHPYRNAPSTSDPPFQFVRFNVMSAAPWDGSMFPGYASFVFWETEGSDFAEALKEMIRTARYLAPKLKESLWPAVSEWIEKQNYVEVP